MELVFVDVVEFIVVQEFGLSEVFCCDCKFFVGEDVWVVYVQIGDGYEGGFLGGCVYLIVDFYCVVVFFLVFVELDCDGCDEYECCDVYYGVDDGCQVCFFRFDLSGIVGCVYVDFYFEVFCGVVVQYFVDVVMLFC